MRCHKQTVHVKDRQRVNQYVVRRPAPIIFERERIREQVVVREHRALAAPRRAARVQNRSEIVCTAVRDFVAVALRRHGIR